MVEQQLPYRIYKCNDFIHVVAKNNVLIESSKENHILRKKKPVHITTKNIHHTNKANETNGQQYSEIKDAKIAFHTACVLIHAVSIARYTQVGRMLTQQWIHIPGRDIIISCIFRHFCFDRHCKIRLSICKAIRLKTMIVNRAKC